MKEITTIDDVKVLFESARSIDREIQRLRADIEERRQELLGTRHPAESVRVMSSRSDSIPERVYFALEKLYVQYSELLQQQLFQRAELENAIKSLDPIEQEIARAIIAGKTEEQIAQVVGYSRPTIARKKRRILLKIAKIDTT